MEEPRYAEDVVFDTKKLEVNIYVAFRTAATLPCPECGELSGIHDTAKRTWMHLYCFQYPTYIHARIPRVVCEKHGTRTVKIPWSRPKSKFSEAFELFLVILCREISISAAARIVEIHCDSAWRILRHHVEQARKRHGLSRLRKVGVDDASVKKGHNYVSAFCDIDKSRVVQAEEGKDSSVITRFKNWIEGKQMADPRVDPERIVQFCSDISPVYVLGIETNFPRTEITFDRYHVIAVVNRALVGTQRPRRGTEVSEEVVFMGHPQPPPP